MNKYKTFDEQASIEEYKIIDYDKRGNIIRFYLAKDRKLIKEAWGDDWDDSPYEHNAGTVYSEYVEKIIDVYFVFDDVVTSPDEDWTYGGNSPYSKEDFKKGNAPMLCIYTPEKDEWRGAFDYHYLVGSKNATKIYFGDSIKIAIDLGLFYVEVEKNEIL